MANNPEQLFGDYAASYNSSVTRTPSEGLADVAGHVLYAAGCTDNKCLYYNKSSISAAISGSDMIVVCLGTGNPYLGKNVQNGTKLETSSKSEISNIKSSNTRGYVSSGSPV